MISNFCQLALLAATLMTLSAGCQQWYGPSGIHPIGNAYPAGAAPFQQPMPGQPIAASATNQPGGNTVFVPVSNEDLAWEQIVDVVDDYFRIERESRVQVVGNMVTEGRIDTFPQVGATWLEPHRCDSVGWDNRWESTFQTIRRRAVLQVLPQQGGYLVEATVFKELEDLPRPENSTAGAASFRNDNSLPSRLDETVERTRFSENWIPLGRDPMLEQQLLADIRSCIAVAQ